MRRSPSIIIIIVIVSLIAITIFPVYISLIQIPQFSRLYRENTVHEAAILAGQLGDLLLIGQPDLQEGAQSSEFDLHVEALRGDDRFFKLKLYAPDGEVVYSDDDEEIGKQNTQDYFREIVETGEIFTKEVEPGSRSMENQAIGSNIVEIYVPVERSGAIKGVFELYYDISDQMGKLKQVVYRSYGVLFGVSLVLLLAVIGASIKAGTYLRERKGIEEKLRSLSISDEMTGLYNRRGFYALAEQQKKLADRSLRGMLLIMADLNGLKKINDNFGHEAGDTILIEATKVLKECFRESDIIARLGGDEFAVLMPEQPAISESVLMNRLEMLVAGANSRREADYTLSISVGFARYDPHSPRSFDGLMSVADARMYEQKRKHKQTKKNR